MKHKLTRNIGLKFLSLIVAFLIWILVGNINDPIDSQLYKDIKIQTVNAESVTEIDKTFDFVSTDTVVIKVTERESVRKRLSRDSFTVIADMESLNEMNSVPLTVICSNPAVTLDEIQVVPSAVKVKLEQKTQKDFVVNIEQSGNPENGYEVGIAEVVQGKTVQIAGPESLVNRIGQVKATVKVSRINTDQRITAPLTITDKNGDGLTETEMSRLQIKDSTGVLLSENSVMVDVTLWERMSDIPVEVQTTGTPAEGYQLTGVSSVPVTVSLAGTQEALARIGGKVVLKDKISIAGATESFTQELDINETLADVEELRMASGAATTISVTVQIEKIGDQTLELPLSNLEVQNRPENMTLTFSPADALQVSVHANEGLGAIRLSDIRAQIDLAVCDEPGDYEIPVQIELPDGYSLVSDVTLRVNSTKAEKLSDNGTKNSEE